MAFAPNPHRLQFQCGVLKQIADRTWCLAIAINQLRSDVLQLRFCFHARDPFIHSQPLVFLFDVVGRKYGCSSRDSAESPWPQRPASPFISAPQRAPGICVVKLKSDRLDVATLLSAEKISRASQFEIKRSNLETSAQDRREFLQSGKPSPRKWEVNSISAGNSRYA